MVYCLLVTLLRVLCHLWGTHFMYLAIIHYMDVAGWWTMLNFSSFAIWWIRVIFSSLVTPLFLPSSLWRRYRLQWSIACWLHFCVSYVIYGELISCMLQSFILWTLLARWTMLNFSSFAIWWIRVIFFLFSYPPIPAIVFMDAVGVWKVMKSNLLADRFIQAEFDMNESETRKRITMMFLS